jgi:hypothetical protein
MSIDGSSLGDVAALATALGLLDGSGDIVAGWFENPGPYLGAMLREAGQRDALVQFVQDALGDQTAPVTDDPGRTWVPLFGLTEAVSLFAVLEPNGRGTVVSAGARIAATAPASVDAEIRVPLLRVNAGPGVVFLPGLDSADPGDVADATATLSATVTVADNTLNSVGLTASVPLTTSSGTPSVGVVVHGLQLPGASQPIDVTLDSASAIGPELAHLLTAVLQAEAASATGAARDLLGLLGLLPAAGSSGASGIIPPLPVADIMAGGLPALRQWLQTLATTPAAMQAWMALLADLTGATAVAGGPPYVVNVAVGRATVGLVVDVAVTEGGDLAITPGVTLGVTSPLTGFSEVSVAAAASLARIQLGAHPGVRALPLFSLTARYGGDSGTIVSVSSPAMVTVGALQAGLALDDGRKPVFVLGAERVDIGKDAAHLHHHDLLDLTSPDALADVGAETLDAVVAGMLGGIGAAGTAISVLIGLTPPASRAGDPSWPALSAPAFVADPVSAVAAFVSSVAALGGTGLADLLSVLPGLLGSGAAGAGTGTADQPWTLDLTAGAALSVWLDGSVLHMGVRVAPEVPPLGGAGGPSLGVALVLDGLAVTLPTGSAGVSVAALPSLSLEVTLASPSGLTFGTGYQVSVSALRLTLGWGPSTGLAVSFDLPGASVAGVPLPPITLGPGGRFSAPLELPWELASQAAASALRAAAPAWAQGLPDLLGLDDGAFDAAGGLAALISDPLRFLRTLLATLLAGQSSGDFAASLAGALAALGGGAAGSGVTGGIVTGSGSADDPFAAPAGTGAAVPSLVLWLSPDGPAPAPGALDGVLEALGRWLDGDPASTALGLDTVAALLGQAAAGSASLRGLLAGRLGPAGGQPAVLAAGLAALQARVAGGDGLLPGTSAEIPGATSVPLPGVTHGGLSAAVDLATVLGAPPEAAAVVYVTGPFEPPWPGTDAVTFDLTAPGLDATGFDVSRASAQDGPWQVRLAARAACPGANADAQLQAQAARLQRVTDAVAARRGGGVVLVAHGSAGQAARLVASQSAGVAQLVLLGVPASGLPLDVLDVPPAADVLQLLRRLLPDPDPGTPDDANLAAGRAILGTLGAVYDSALAPANDFLPPQALGAQAPPTWSVRGAIDVDTATRALAAVIRAGVYAAASDGGASDGGASDGGASDGADPGPWTAPTALRGGLRMQASSPPATAGPGPAGIAVDVAVTLSTALVSLAGPPDGPTAELVVTLSRPGGWLAGGPQGVPAAPDVSRTPALRRAELRVSADLAGAGVRARITLDEVNALGLVADRLVLGDGGGPVTPEARVLLGRLAGTLGPPPAGSPLAGLVALLGAAGLTDPTVAAPAVGLSVDAVTKLIADPAGQLRGALGSAAARAAVAAALAQVFADTTSPASQAAVTVGGLTLAVDLGAPTAALHVSAASLALAGGITVTADAGIDAQGHWSGSVTLAPSGPPGPAGRPQLSISAGPAGPAVGLHLGGLAQADLSLWPLSSGAAVAGLLPAAAAMFGGMLARDLIGAVRDLDQARLDPVLGLLGLLDGSGATATVRLPAGLVADPAGWLGQALAGQGLDPDRVASLVDAVRELAGLPAAGHGTLPLPLGAALTVGPGAGGGLAVTLAVTADAGDLHVACSGGLTVRPGGAAPAPVLTVAVGPAGQTAALQLGLTGSSLTAALALGNGNTVQLYPSGPGLGSLTSAAVTAALPLVLSSLEQHGPDPVPAVLAAVRVMLGLGATAASWDSAQLSQLAADPAGELGRRLAARGPGALASLINASQQVLPSGWSVDTSDPQAVTLTIGTAPVQQQVTLRYVLSPPAFSCGIAAGISLDVAGLGIIGTAQVTVDGTGLRLADLTVGIDPARPASLGPTGLTLAPFARLTAGADAAGGARAQAGLAVTAGGQVHALAVTVAAGPPVSVSAGSLTDGQPDGTPDIAAVVTGFVIPALADVALADPSVTALLAKTVLGGPTVSALLQGVILTGSSFDPAALNPAQALPRLLTLAGNVAAAGPAVTVGDYMKVEIAQVSNGPVITYGIGVTVEDGERVELNTGDVVLAIEVDSTWTDILPAASPGLSVLLLDHSGAAYSIAASPAVLVNGVGLRVLRSSGPLLDTGLQIGSVALYGLLDIDAHGVQAAGGKLELADLGVAVASASGGDNAVAQGVLGDAASGGSGGGGDNTPLRPQFSPALALEKPAGGPVKWSLRAGDGNGPWWIVIQRSFGPLHIEQIGFGVDQDGSTVHGLRVLIDGGLSMLGLSIEVEELSVGATWPPPGPALTDPHAWSIDLDGLAAGYSGGSVSLAGALRKRGSPPDYTGVLIARLGPYGLTAFGGYGQFTAPDGAKYTALFVVAGITAPIGGPPAFFITGLGGGAGINRQLVLPATMDDFPNYPLVAALDPHSTLASDPETALDELSAAFPPERGTFWFAAGVSFTSFALVDVTAVIAVSVGDGFQVALLGLGRMALPTTYAPLVQVELALQARFSTTEGALVVQAQLTQNSWLLTPDCRLTGGFAYASFFGANPNAGQMVLSIGGYHPDFHHDGYPVVPRVGYVWSVASVLTISGQSYFAITSEAIMAGTRFTASLDLGFLWASLIMGIDAIVYFDPFSFDATGYASIAAGVSISVDLGFFGTIEVNLSFHLGATVHVHGPDFSGSASIDLDVTSATISFGSGNDNSTKQLGWSDFSAKYLTAGGASVLSAMPQAGQLTGTVTTSAGTTPTGDADKPWKFVAEWSLSVVTTAAATALQLPSSALSYDLSQVPGIASMAIDALTSTLAVTIAGSAGGDVAPPVLGPSDPGEGLRVALVTAPLPKGVWTANPNDGSVPSGDTITAGTGFILQAEATVEGATPQIPVNQIEPTKGRKPLPFAQETAARPARQPDDANAAAFAAATATGSSSQLVQVALGYLTSGPLSEPPTPMTVLAFGRDRVAPPRPALLTEGMVAPQTPPPATTPVVSPPPPVIDTSIHPPVLASLLGSGPAPVLRPVPRTSVAAAVATATRTALATQASPALPAAAAPPPARVPAPTLASVAALTDPAFAAALTRLAPTALTTKTGLRAADGGPVSLRAATPGELRPGPAASADQSARLAASTAALLAAGTAVRPGDLIVAELPNAARDLDASLPRHTVTVAGDAAVRVVALSVTGRVLADAAGVQLSLVIPQHTARVALWCVGGDGARPAGLAGWTDVSRLPQAGARTLLGADAVVNGVPPATRGQATVSTATVPAGAAAAGAGFVTTRLPADTQVVVVSVDPAGDDRDLTGLTLGLDGASRLTGPDGAALPPTVVTAGARMHLLYGVVPATAGADPPAAVEVTVGTSASWRLTGLLGGPADPATTAARIAAYGVAAIAAPLLRAPTGSATVSWQIPSEVS